MALRRQIASWGSNDGPSAVVEHGANPGLVSHFTKQALGEIADAVLRDGLLSERHGEIREALEAQRFNVLAQLLEVKSLHIAERDTQITDRPKEIGEFVNTWSVDGFYEEGVAPAEMGWGTHEKTLPPLGLVHKGEGPKNQICLAKMAHKTIVRSTVPSGPIIGMVIRHGEAFTICDHLTVWDGERAVYRPTVHYAYCPADVAWASFVELEGNEYVYPHRQRILNDEIISGRDELGVLVMGHPYKAWWTGMRTTIDEARAVAPHQNATTIQVAASILGAVQWMLDAPREGVRVPDELPWREVLDVAMPYVGTLWSGPLDWDPVTTHTDWFDRWSGRELDHDDPWQFTNFLVS
jgi:homospermidine synthase